MKAPSRPSAALSRRGTLRSPFLWLPLLPFFLFGLFMELVPIATVVVSSLRDASGQLTLANFSRALSPSLRASFGNSIRLSLSRRAWAWCLARWPELPS
jgi:ABC-type uncharacterized transport system permease subunit